MENPRGKLSKDIDSRSSYPNTTAGPDANRSDNTCPTSAANTPAANTRRPLQTLPNRHPYSDESSRYMPLFPFPSYVLSFHMIKHTAYCTRYFVLPPTTVAKYTLATLMPIEVIILARQACAAANTRQPLQTLPNRHPYSDESSRYMPLFPFPSYVLSFHMIKHTAYCTRYFVLPPTTVAKYTLAP
ncbi:hypothetical protein Tco_1174403 [Tanacetum coccineum]